MAEQVYDAAEEVARIHIVKGLGGDSQDFACFPICEQWDTIEKCSVKE